MHMKRAYIRNTNKPANCIAIIKMNGNVSTHTHWANGHHAYAAEQNVCASDCVCVCVCALCGGSTPE